MYVYLLQTIIVAADVFGEMVDHIIQSKRIIIGLNHSCFLFIDGVEDARHVWIIVCMYCIIL